MYTCTQQGYICTRIDFCFNVLTYLLRIAISLWWPNYVLYFGVTILLNTAANLTVAWRFRRDFPYVRDTKVTLEDFRALGIFRDLRYYLVHRLSNTIYGSSDTIVTSRMGGAAQTAKPWQLHLDLGQRDQCQHENSGQFFGRHRQHRL